MEVVSQTAIRVINETKTLYIFPWCIMAIYSLICSFKEHSFKEQKDKISLLAIVPLISFTIIALFANRESMYHSIEKYEYTIQYAINVPEIDSSKYTIVEQTDMPEPLYLVITDILTDEESKEVENTSAVVNIVAVYRLICTCLWLFCIVLVIVDIKHRCINYTHRVIKGRRAENIVNLIEIVGLLSSIALALSFCASLLYCTTPLPI